MLVSYNLKDVLAKLDNVFMVYILPGFPKDHGSVRDQSLTNNTIPMVEEFINPLIRVSSESSALISNSSDCSSGVVDEIVVEDVEEVTSNVLLVG